MKLKVDGKTLRVIQGFTRNGKEDRVKPTDVQKIITAGINKFGADTVYKGGDVAAGDLGYISTGSFAFDWALGCPGIPIGRVTEIFGEEGSGKTSLALHIMGNVQRDSGIACYIETEHVWDPNWAATFGVDVANLPLGQPHTLEEACEMVEFFIDHAYKVTKGAKPILVIWDSVAGTPAKGEVEDEVANYNKHVGEHARLLSYEFRRITQQLAQKSVALVLVNQLKTYIPMGGWSPPGAHAHALQKLGGRAVNFHASMQIKVTRKALIKTAATEPPVGINIGIHLVKNKVGMPYRKVDARLIFGKGFDAEATIFPFMVTAGLVTGGPGGWFKFPSVFGDQNVHEADITKALQDNAELLEKVKAVLLDPNAQAKLEDTFKEEPGEEGTFECSECKGAVPNSATVCPHCGAEFEDDGTEEGAVQDPRTTDTVPPNGEAPPPPPVEEKEDKEELPPPPTAPPEKKKEDAPPAEPPPEKKKEEPPPAEEDLFECSECHGDVPMSANVCPHCKAQFADEGGTVPEDDLEGKTRPELAPVCKELGLPFKGKKDEIIAAIRKARKKVPPETPPADPGLPPADPNAVFD